jgi:hypothetical protein
MDSPFSQALIGSVSFEILVMPVSTAISECETKIRCPARFRLANDGIGV